MKLKIWNQTRSTLLGAEVEVADTSSKRRTGLLNHTCSADGHGLLIIPCEAIHTFGMRFPIDVVFIDGKKKVVKLRPSMGRWRIAFSFWAKAFSSWPPDPSTLPGPRSATSWPLRSSTRAEIRQV